MQLLLAISFIVVMAVFAVIFYKEGSELGQFASVLFALTVGLSVAALLNLI